MNFDFSFLTFQRGFPFIFFPSSFDVRLDFRCPLVFGLSSPRSDFRGDDRGLIFPKKRLEIEPILMSTNLKLHKTSAIKTLLYKRN